MTFWSGLLAASLLLSAAPAPLGGAPGAGVATQAGVPTDAWVKLATDPYRGKRDDVSFSDAAHGWYGTGAGDLFATEDGGATWTKVASRPGTFIRAVGFVDDKVGFIGNVGVGYYPGVKDTTPLYRTEDGGRTWKAVEAGAASAGVCAIDILKTQRIHQGRLEPRTVITAAGRVGGPAALIRSSDSGATWRTVDMSRWTGMILDVKFLNERVGFVAGASSSDVATAEAQILRTRDGGDTWTEVYRSKRPKELVWKLSFPTGRTAYGTVMSYDESRPDKVIVKTTDGGGTWREKPLVSNGKAVELGVGFIDEKRGWVGTTVGGFETLDGGESFHPSHLAVAANKIRVVSGPQGASVYAIGTELQQLRIDGARRPAR